MSRLFWLLGGLVSLLLGIVGLVLPLVPTVPLLLLAAFCFARSSEALHDWLLAHPKLGPPIHAWRQRGAIGQEAKLLASLSMGVTFGVSVFLALSLWVLFVQGIVLVTVAIFIWTRPEE